MVRHRRDPARSVTFAPDQGELSTMAGWLAALIAGGALAAMSVRFLPYWPIEHQSTDLGIGMALLPAAVLLWVLRRRASRWLIHAGLLVGLGCITGAVWAVGPTPETQAPALFYGFVAAFTSAFLTRRIAWAYLGLAGIQYLSVLALHWRAEMATQWAIGMLAITLPSAVISTLVSRLRALALRDPLTGLANRRLLEQVLPLRMSHARRRGAPLSIAALDLDGLKTINDLAGHAAGDRLLVSVARGFTRALREEDVLARIGGDEFILVLPGTNLAEAQLAVQRLRMATPGVAFSAGVVRWMGETLDEVLHHADAALYAAKQAGGARTVAHTRTEKSPSSGGTPPARGRHWRAG